MNPILPLCDHIPDGEAHVMPDGRLYLYGSLDLSGSPDYCSRRYKVYSTDDPKLADWKSEGVSFDTESADFPAALGDRPVLYAPDAICRGGKYYLYFCTSGNREATAVSDSPAGPFIDARALVPADGDGIDPAVFVDGDGQAYFLWGQFNLRMAKLNADMRSIDSGSVVTEVLTEREHGFHEGASMRKFGDTYYIVYTDISRGAATCLGYATSDAPMGPYTKRGIIIDNAFCDPKNWNNHGSIERFRGQWYVFYHRSSQCSNTSRRMCAEPITILPDGSIPEVYMTSQGVGAPLDVFAGIDAARACRMKGRLYIAARGDGDDYREYLADCGGGSWDEAWAEYKYIDFSGGVRTMRLRGSGHGTVRFIASGFGEFARARLDSDDICVAGAEVVKSPDGVRAVWLSFDGDMDIESFVGE